MWKLILNGIILRTRPRPKARDYLKIWNVERNDPPLKTITRSQSDKLAAAISDHDHVVVDWAMRYGNPSIKSRIDALTGQGCTRLLVVPLYPQYSAPTSATVCDEVFRVLGEIRAQPTLRVTPPTTTTPITSRRCGLDQRASGDATVSARADLGVFPWHAAEICRPGRSLLRAVRRNDRRPAQAPWPDAAN